MKKVLYLSAAILLLSGCGDEEDGPFMNANNQETAVEETEPNEEETPANEEETEMDKEPETTPEAADETALSEYSAEQIEYARVWLQLGANQEIDGLYVNIIPEGTPLNPDDETSAAYPEDVIQLAGSRLVDGSVTYSGNGDGTVNLYNVPLRWDGEYPAGEEFYTEIIENTELVAIDPGNDEEVIRLIELLQDQP
ncbi:hypothetical protein BN1080_02854 [Planococcus massiliensis]|uniref:Lipoprotein n=1 Tax=Planococcus massiliensis TaxID=1499687 RepID=A0A098EPZ8_9BACL|nr:hypothetical protein [Planococcus massiliensis]CEG23847.1 hypothetical protein BN1080_02854 [Planococcus massiliensis]